MFVYTCVYYSIIMCSSKNMVDCCFFKKFDNNQHDNPVPFAHYASDIL